MKLGLRAIAMMGGLLIGGLILPATANAWYSHTEASASMRTGPGVKYKRIATIPAGSRLWVEWCKSNWCYATWKNIKGYVAASLIAAPRRGGPVYDNYYDYNAYNDYWWLYYNPPGWHYPPHCKKGHHCWPKPPHCKKGDCPKPPKPPKWDGPKGPKGPKFDGPTWNGPKSQKSEGPRFDGPRMRMNDGGFRPDAQMNVAPSIEMRGPSGDRDGGGDRGDRGSSRDRWKN